MKEIRKMNVEEILSLIGKEIYAIRNHHKGNNRRNFYISTLNIKNIIISNDGIWIDTGFEIFHEEELGHRFNLNINEIKDKLEYVKNQEFNNISQIFKVRIKK